MEINNIYNIYNIMKNIFLYLYIFISIIILFIVYYIFVINNNIYELMTNDENKMTIIGNKYNTDKVTHHNYDKIFPLFIQQFYDKDGAIIEIGVENKYSLNMYLDLFPNMFIYAYDINLEDKGDRYLIYKGDQSKIEDLNNFASIINKKIYFINDDGSHLP